MPHAESASGAPGRLQCHPGARVRVLNSDLVVKVDGNTVSDVRRSRPAIVGARQTRACFMVVPQLRPIGNVAPWPTAEMHAFRFSARLTRNPAVDAIPSRSPKQGTAGGGECIVPISGLSETGPP